MSATLKALVGREGPFLQVQALSVDTSAAMFADSVRALDPRAWVRVVDGAASPTAKAFFAQAAQAFELPKWFGHNWNALQDVLNDIPGGPKVLVFDAASALLEDEPPRAFETLVKVLRAAAEARAEAGAEPLHAVFVTAPGEAATVQARLEG